MPTHNKSSFGTALRQSQLEALHFWSDAMSKVLILFCALLLVPLNSSASNEQTYEELMDRLTAITGYSAEEMAAPALEAYSRSLAEHLVSQKPQLPPRAVDVISNEILIFLHEQMFINPEVKSLKYEVYKKYFTKDEIKELISFYGTPLGRKLIESTPLLLQELQEGMNEAFESVKVNLIESVAPRVNQRMKENGW